MGRKPREDRSSLRHYRDTGPPVSQQFLVTLRLFGELWDRMEQGAEEPRSNVIDRYVEKGLNAIEKRFELGNIRIYAVLPRRAGIVDEAPTGWSIPRASTMVRLDKIRAIEDGKPEPNNRLIRRVLVAGLVMDDPGFLPELIDKKIAYVLGGAGDPLVEWQKQYWTPENIEWLKALAEQTATLPPTMAPRSPLSSPNDEVWERFRVRAGSLGKEKRPIYNFFRDRWKEFLAEAKAEATKASAPPAPELEPEPEPKPEKTTTRQKPPRAKTAPKRRTKK